MTKGKVSCEASFQAGTDLYKVQKQDRDENVQGDYRTTEQWKKGKTRRLLYVCCMYMQGSRCKVFLSSFPPSFHSRVVYL